MTDYSADLAKSVSTVGTQIDESERIGDHCTNIAEWVEFSVTGVHKDCQ